MQIGVYGSGYLGTVISACLADFGTPVSCCHPDRSRMVEMAQGNIPFFEKNLKEIIRRNVRAGRLAYSTDIESFARKTQVIFLAEDKAEGLADMAMRIARLAAKPPILTIVTPAPVGTASALEKGHQRRRPAGHHRFAAHVLHRWLRRRRFQLARPPDPRIDFERSRADAEADFSSPRDARRSGDCDQPVDRGTGSRSRHGVRGD